MSVPVTFDMGKVLIKEPKIFFSRKKYLFLLSHLKGHTSLLSKILIEHRDISGFSEMHLSYRKRRDLMMLRYKVYKYNGNNLNGKYVFDKLVYDFSISKNLLMERNLKLIFMLRQPEATLKDLIVLSKEMKNPSRFKNIDMITSYYLERLDKLERIARYASKRNVYLDAEKLIDNPDTVLRKLSGWLHLSSKLTMEDNIAGFDELKENGHRNKNIKDGEIVKESQYDDLEIPWNVLQKANDKYNRCRKVLMKNCIVI